MTTETKLQHLLETLEVIREWQSFKERVETTKDANQL